MIFKNLEQTSTRGYTAPECEVVEMNAHQPLMQSLEIQDITEENMDW